MFPPGDDSAVTKQATAMPARRRMMGAGPMGGGQGGPLAGGRPPMRPPGMMGRGPMPGMGAPQGLGGGVPRMPMMAQGAGKMPGQLPAPAMPQMGGQIMYDPSMATPTVTPQPRGDEALRKRMFQGPMAF